MASSNESKGDAFVAEAEKKLNSGGFMSLFTSKKDKHREAAEIFNRAASTYKLDKKCMVTLNI